MRRRLAIIFALIVFLPLVLLAGLTIKVTGDDQALVAHQFQNVIEERLADLERSVAQSLEEVERGLLKATNLPHPDQETIASLVRKEPFARQVFVLDAQGSLLFPDRRGGLTLDENAFLLRTESIWDRRAVLYDPQTRYELSPKKIAANASEGVAPGEPNRRRTPGDSLIDLAKRRGHGWIAWYWDEGLHLLFWRRADDSGVIGMEVERIALFARLVGRLPTSEQEEGRVVLADARGQVLYQWGRYEGATGEQPLATVPLSYPLDAWRLEYFPSPAQQSAFSSTGFRLPVVYGLAAVALGLIALALYFLREYARDLREAGQRVTFVTQVSHELKTPLTNIRLYAEMLEDELEDDESRAQAHLAVIVRESQRLSRLIGNVLTFSKRQKGPQQIHPRPMAIDPLIRQTVDQFGPAFAHKNVVVTIEPGAPKMLVADPDAVEQILANLLGNVEKYGAAGGKLKIKSEQTRAQTKVTVEDAGPGIPASLRERVFEPFFRVSQELTDGVTGTGIGLTIARELARRHGGDLKILPSTTGACFELVLPLTAEEAAP